MNAFTKFVAMPMRGHGNVTGADVVLRYTTGYPFGISLTRGYPRFNPGEYSTIDLLGPRRQRRDARARCRPRRDDAEAGHRAPEAHADDRARPEGDAHKPPGPRPHHDGRDRHQRTRHRLPDGRNPAAAAPGAEVALPDRRGGDAANSRSGAEERAVVRGAKWGDANGVNPMLPYSSIPLVIVVVLTVRHARSPLASERSKLAVIVLAVVSFLLTYVITAPVILGVLLQIAICAYIILHQTILTPEDQPANR